MKIAMFEGYAGFGESASDPRVEEAIRAHVAIMQQAQSALWDAHSSWRNGKWISGVLIPISALARIANYDWSEAVDAWQASVDRWWSEEFTDAVRNDPFTKGQDGTTRLDAWIKMGEGLLTWGKRIANDMADDNLANTFGGLVTAWRQTLTWLAQQGLKIASSLLPTWVYVGAAAIGGLILYNTFRRRS